MDQPARQNRQMVRTQRFPGRGDVRNRLGGQVLDRSFRRPLAVDQLVVGHAGFAQEVADQAVILGGDPEAVSVTTTEVGGSCVQIVERVHVNPEGRHGNDEVCEAKAHGLEFSDHVRPGRDALAHQVAAGDAQVDAPRLQFARDLSGAEQHKVHVRPVNMGGIFPVRPAAPHVDAAFSEPVEGLFHQPALGGHAQFQGHARPSRNCCTSSGRTTPPTAGISCPRPSTRVSAS